MYLHEYDEYEGDFYTFVIIVQVVILWWRNKTWSNLLVMN